MIIAIDYDDTYTADPVMWDAVIHEMFIHGHIVYCVTCRRDTPENRERCSIIPDDVPIFFTGLKPKRTFMEKLGIKIDVWIDDMPESVEHGR